MLKSCFNAKNISLLSRPNGRTLVIAEMIGSSPILNILKRLNKMGYLLILWIVSYPFQKVPVMQSFETQRQCQMIGEHIMAEQHAVSSFECVGIPRPID